MRYRSITKYFMVVVALALFIGGCISSGTFVISKSFSFTIPDDMVSKPFDLTTDGDWLKHQDEIDDIDAVGFDVWVSNTSQTAGTFNVWINRPTVPTYTDVDTVKARAVHILEGFKLPTEINLHLTYGSSFQYLKNIDSLKSIVQSGEFDLYFMHSEALQEIRIDSGKVVITFSAH